MLTTEGLSDVSLEAPSSFDPFLGTTRSPYSQWNTSEEIQKQ